MCTRIMTDEGYDENLDQDDYRLYSPCDETLLFLFRVVHDATVLSFKMIKIFFSCFVAFLFGRSEKDVTGQVIVISGAGHGFGKEMALLFASRGAKLALLDINKEGVDEVANEINSTGGVATPYVCDVTSYESIVKTFGTIKTSLGSIDILINNAGIVNCRPFLEIEPPAMERTMKVNTLAHMYTTRVVLPDMISRGKGQIVGISSVAAVAGNANMTDYTASKHAILGFMKALDIELHDKGQNQGVKLTTVCPFGMRTGMFQDMTTRFPLFFDYLDPKEAAQKAVHGILTEEQVLFIPKFLEMFFKVGGLLPTQAGMDLQHFLGIRINPNPK